MPANAFEFFSAAELAEQRAAYKACILALATTQSYTLNGVSISRAQLDAVKSTLADIEQAIRRQSGTAIIRAHPITRPLF